MAREQISPEMRRLSTYVSGALKRKLPQKVVDRAKLHLLDTFAAIISGSRQLPGQRAISFVKPLGGTPEAGVMGTRIVTTTINAALANGMFCHADETDDTHPPTRTHPGASVTPAALAIAEKRQLSARGNKQKPQQGFFAIMQICFQSQSVYTSNEIT